MLPRPELERIYDQHAACAAALFRRFTQGNEADTRDLLQDWLVKLTGSLETTEGIANERAFLLRIAYRLAVDWSRRRQSRGSTLDRIELDPTQRPEFEPQPNPDRELIRETLETSLESLPQDQQLVIQMKLWDDMTFAEIGAVLDVSPHTAASRYRYGLAKLREALRPVYDELCA